MKELILSLVVILLFGCSQQPVFDEVACNTGDSIENENLRNIFKPCREFIYSAKYWDPEYNQISNELIRVVVTGKAWDPQPESQDDIVIQYAYDTSKVDLYEQYSLNPEITRWTTITNTGIIENSRTVWMHPFRSNQYLFTEVAPFPEASLPLEIGKTWYNSLSIHEGWGLWADSEISNGYEVVAYEMVELPLGNLNAWHIQSASYASFGDSVHSFWFNEDYGFIKMVYKNYAGQILKFELVEVNDL